MANIAQGDETKPLVTLETFLNIKSHDRKGSALMLYCFYAMKAADRDEGQPYCNDEWTAGQLNWNTKTVRRARQTLSKAGVIIMIRKGRKRYIQVQYLPFVVSNKKHRSLGTENIPLSVMTTTEVFNYYSKWYDSIQGNPTRFINTVRKQTGINASKDKILQYLAGTYSKICARGYGIERVDNELSFFYYLMAGVNNKIKIYEKRMQA